jgi:hypothetical protein
VHARLRSDRSLPGRSHPVDPYRFGDILDSLFAEIGAGGCDLCLHLFVRRPGNRDAARLGHGLQAVGNVGAVAMNVVALDDDVAEVDADAEHQAAILGQRGIARALGTLDIDGTADGVDDAAELDQQAVAHGLDQSAVVLGNPRLEYVVEIGLESRARPLLVDLAEAAIAGDIGDHHGSEPALHAPLPGRTTKQELNELWSISVAE